MACLSARKGGDPMTVSAPMQARLDRLEEHLKEHDLRVEKRNGIVPVLCNRSSNSTRPLPTGGATGTGFSWIAFFWPFAVLTQIREFSYFGFVAVLSIITAWIHILTGVDVSVGADIGICIMYAYWFPYLRYIAIQEEREEISVPISIILGLLLIVAASIPATVLETLFIS